MPDMTKTEEMLVRARAVQLGNYRPAPLVLSRGEGCRLFDVDGRAYLDLSGGVAVVSVGHAHPVLAVAIAEQAARLMHVSNLFYNDRAIELAEAIVARTQFDRVYFANSGAEANEAMLKLARRYHHDRGDEERVEIVAAWRSFHGRTMGALSVTGQPKYHEGMKPLIGAVRFVDYGDAAALRAAVGPRTAAVILEPIQAEGGIHIAPDAYLREARACCDQAGALLLFDEVQTGYGRTGRFLAQEHSGVGPDACALAKGIGGGFPLSAMAVTERVAGGLPPGSHATTFGGNPLACAAGLAVLRIFDDERLVERAAAHGDYLAGRLAGLGERHACVVDVRGRGLMWGVELAADRDVPAVIEALRARGVLAALAGPTVVRFVPPLVVTRAELDEGVDALDAVLAAGAGAPS